MAGQQGPFVNYDRPSDRKREAVEAAAAAKKGRKPKASDFIEGVDQEEKELDYDEELIEGDVFSGAGKKARRNLRTLDDDSDEEREGKKVKPAKKVRFISHAEIEGQEQSTGAEFDSDGTRIEPFNMDEELEEGDFDEAGFYTLKKDAKDSHDPWLDSISAADIRKAKRGKEKQEKIREEKDLDRSSSSVKQALQQVVNELQPKETPMLALKRLGGGFKSSTSKKRTGASEPTQLSMGPPSDDRRKFDLLTEACDRLVGMGEYGVYSDTREEISRKLGVSTEENEDDMSTSTQTANNGGNSDVVTWQYKWTEDSEVYGPMTSEQMNAWVEQGMFGEGVLVRKIQGNQEPSGEFYSSKRVDFSLYMDD